MVTRSRAKRVGEQIEAVVIERRGFEAVDREAVDAPDAVANDGTPVEVKACKRRISNGSGETAGRWYLRRRAHEALLEEGGDYLLVVYDEADGSLEVLDEQLVPADVVDAIVSAGSWSRVRSRGEETVAKLRHSVVSDVGEGSA